jgi:hypothetical protein
MTLEKNRHEALSIMLVDDLLLTSLDLVRLTIASRLKQDPPKKNFSAVLYESQELSWRQVGGGGSNLQTPAASPLAAVAPDDAVEGFKNAAVDCVSLRDFLCGGRRLVVVSFSASTTTNET